MNSNRTILLMTPDSRTHSEVLAASGTGFRGEVNVLPCKGFDDLERKLGQSTPPVALVDIEPDTSTALARLERLVATYSDTRFVVICGEFRSDVVLEAMQIGARHCLVRTSVENELCPVLERLLRGSSGSQNDGRVVTVLSASGGCGATSIAINVAQELTLATDETALLVDLDGSYGSVGTYLGLTSDFGIVDILARRHGVDRQLITSTASAYSDSLHVLLSPATVDFGDPAPIPLDNLGLVLGEFSNAYPFCVIDAPRVPMRVAAELAKASEITLLVFELAVIDIRTARAMISALIERGVPRERILPVANRHRRRGAMLSLEDAQEALGVDEVVRVTNDFESAIRSINFGQPLSKIAPRSPMRKTVRDLADMVNQRLRTKAG